MEQQIGTKYPQDEEQCEHTLVALGPGGKTTGSWADELVVDEKLGRRHRIACRFCGRFYGYLIRTRAERQAVAVAQP